MLSDLPSLKTLHVLGLFLCKNYCPFCVNHSYVVSVHILFNGYTLSLISLDLALYLKERYESMLHSETKFIQLTMTITQQSQHGIQEALSQLAKREKIEDVLFCEKASSLPDIFLPSPRDLPPHSSTQLPRVLVVEGPTGVGKSTLALHICHEWARSADWLVRFDIVILVYLRDPVIHNAKVLADILPAPNMEISQSASKMMQASNGNNVLFIFDGWDEFPPHCKKNSVISTIINQPDKLYLQHSTVLITSLPNQMLHIANRQIKLLGFTYQQIFQYIGDGNKILIKKISDHFEEHPAMKELCCLPLHVAMLVNVFKTNNVVPACSIAHELVGEFVLCCVLKNLKMPDVDSNLRMFSSLNDLHENVRSQVYKLGQLAYKGLMENKLVFSQLDWQDVEIPTDPPLLGLLQKFDRLLVTNHLLSFTFTSQSVQEFLAAYYLLHLDNQLQLSALKLISSISCLGVVINYMCVLAKQPTHLNLTKISSLLQFILGDTPKQLSLHQLISPSFRNLQVHSSTLMDYSAVGYFIALLLQVPASTDVPNQKLSCQFFGIDDVCLKSMLDKVISCAGEKPKGELVLEFIKSSISGEGAKLLSAFLQQSFAVVKILFDDGNIQSKDNDGLLHLSQALQANSHLTVLRLKNMNLLYNEVNGLTLKKMVSMNETLEHLDLSGNSLFSDSGACCILHGLMQNRTLVTLSLHKICLTATEETNRLLSEMLRVNTTLKHLDLSSNLFLSDSGICSIFEGLQSNSTLLRLNICDTNISFKGAIRMADSLQHGNCSLRILNIGMNSIGTNGFARIANSLKFHKPLEQLLIQRDAFIESKAQEVNLERKSGGWHRIDFKTTPSKDDSYFDKQLAELESAIEKFESLTTTVIHCIPFGPPRVGKSCIKQRLVGKMPKGKRAEKGLQNPKGSSSTGVAENHITIHVHPCSQQTFQRSDSVVWKEVDLYQEALSLVKGWRNLKADTHQSSESESEDQKVSSMNESKREEVNASNMKNDDGSHGLKVTEGIMDGSHSLEMSERKSLFETNQHVQKTETVKQLQQPTNEDSFFCTDPLQPFKDASASVNYSDIAEMLKKTTTIHFTDTGGQPEFQEVLPMLVSGCSLFLLVFDLSRNINDPCVVSYVCRGEVTGTYECSFTVKGILLECLATIACIGTRSETSKDEMCVPEKLSKVFIVGTQKDLVDKTKYEEVIQDINKQLQDAIKDLENFIQVVPFKGDQLLFTVNNYDNKDEAFKSLRNKVEEAFKDSRKTYEVTLPISYFLLDILLRQPKKIQLSREQCNKIASKYDLTIDHLEELAKVLLAKTGKHIDHIDVTDPDLLHYANQSLSNFCDDDLQELNGLSRDAFLDLYQLSHYRQPVITTNQFNELALMCNIPKEYHENALFALHHRLGTIRHYEKVEKVVIVNPLFIFVVVTRLIVSCRYSIEHIRECYKLGIFPEGDLHELLLKVLREVWSEVWDEGCKEVDSPVSIKQLITLLEHLYIVAPLKYQGKDSYFLPCVIKHTPHQPDTSDLVDVIHPLLVSFECKFTPKGMFSGLLAHFLQHAGEQNLKWEPCLPKTSELYRDQVEFVVTDYLFVTVRVTREFIKFSLQCEKDLPQESTTKMLPKIKPVAKAVKQVIEEGLTAVAEKASYAINIGQRFGFECTKDTCKSTPHFVKYERDSVLKCDVYKRTCSLPSSSEYSSEYEWWFGK